MTETAADVPPQRATRQLHATGALLRRADRSFGVLLVLGAIGHTTGTLLWMPPMSPVFIWSLGSSIAAATLGVLNIVRAGRRDDRALAAITTVGTTAWLGVVVCFAISLRRVLDPRVLLHGVSSAALVMFSVRMLLGRRGAGG